MHFTIKEEDKGQIVAILENDHTLFMKSNIIGGKAAYIDGRSNRITESTLDWDTLIMRSNGDNRRFIYEGDEITIKF